MDKYPKLRKCLVVGIIFLLLGIAVQPITSMNIAQIAEIRSNDKVNDSHSEGGCNCNDVVTQDLARVNRLLDKIEVNIKNILFNILMKRDYSALSVFHYNFLYLGMMHFMDPYNYDVHRVMHCGVHYVTPDMNVVPFCVFNVLPELYRDNVQQKYSITIDEWNKSRPGSLSDRMKYKRDIKKLIDGETYKNTYDGFL